MNIYKRDLVDTNNRPLQIGSVFDIKQTVNGCSTFILMSVSPVIVNYVWSNGKIGWEYEYDVNDLLDLNKYDTEIEFLYQYEY